MTMDRRPRKQTGSITRLQGFLLLAVARKGSLPMSDVVRILEVGPATVSQFVSSLEERGWVERCLDPQDRRRHLVQITDKGQQVAAKFQENRRLQLAGILEHLSAEERTQLVALAQRVAAVVAAKPEILRRTFEDE